jgi:hypothetical protein
MTASDHAPRQAVRFTLPRGGRPQMESRPLPRHTGVAGLRRIRTHAEVGAAHKVDTIADPRRDAQLRRMWARQPKAHRNVLVIRRKNFLV